MAELDVDGLIRLTLDDFSQLGVIDDGGRLYLPVDCRRRGANGGVELVDKALLTIPTIAQKMRARRESRDYGIKEFKLDLERDKEQFSDLENYAILSFALRDAKTRGQLVPTIADVIQRFTDATLAELWGKLNQWTEMCDPRFGEISSEKLWQVVAGLSRGNLLPLLGMPTYAQSTCFALMAREALSSPNAPSWARSPGTSPSDASAPKTSPGFSEPEFPKDDRDASFLAAD